MWANQLGSRVSERGSSGTGEELIKTSGPASTGERGERGNQSRAGSEVTFLQRGGQRFSDAPLQRSGDQSDELREKKRNTEPERERTLCLIQNMNLPVFVPRVG